MAETVLVKRDLAGDFRPLLLSTRSGGFKTTEQIFSLMSAPGLGY